ncbi:MAG: hypothetical protein AAFQ99_12635 [Pseudomonadota bacterium]
MQSHDRAEITRNLLDAGLSRKDAARMAEEWINHLEELIDDAVASGTQVRLAALEAQQRLGSVKTLTASLVPMPVCVQARQWQRNATVVATWGSACAAGLIATFSMFSVMVVAVGL